MNPALPFPTGLRQVALAPLVAGASGTEGGCPAPRRVPVALVIARWPALDVIVRKLGVPSQPELGMGAIGEEGVRLEPG